MSRKLFCCLTLLAVLAVPMSASAVGGTKVLAENDYLVTFEVGQVKGERARAIIEEAGGTVTRDHLEIGLMAVHSLDPDFAPRLKAHNAVQSVQKDIWIRPDQTAVKAPLVGEDLNAVIGWGRDQAVARYNAQRNSLRAGTASARTLVTDPSLAAFWPFFNWSYLQMDTPGAWATGALGVPEVVTAILDTGVDYTHIDIEGTVDLEKSVSFMIEENSEIENLFPGALPIADRHFHGTLVAGTIACNAIGSPCVAPNSTTVMVKVVDKNLQSSIGRMIAGILYASHIRADIIAIPYHFYPHLSLDNPEDRLATFLLRLAVGYAKLRGAFVVAEAGVDPNMPFREGIDADADGNDRILPAQAGAIGVSGTAVGNRFGNFNNYGFTIVDIAAPGGEFPFTAELTTAIWGPCSRFTRFVEALDATCITGGPGWVNGAGTLGATANVAGIAALVDSLHGGNLRGWQIWRQIRDTADDLGDPGRDPFFGYGQVNARRAVTE
ncbi:MAG: S8 family serine peptidase [Acidobacteriota bacterium]